MNWKEASDKELLTIVTADPAARLSDIVEARNEYERRNRKIPKLRKNWREREAYSK